MFEIDTGNSNGHAAEWSRTPATKSEWAEDNGRLDWSRDPVSAERFHRQTISRIWSVDTVEELDALMAAESLAIDALWLTHPHYAERIDAAATEVRSMIGAATTAKAEPQPAQTGNDGKDKTDDFFF
jgi:hypothetical protein